MLRSHHLWCTKHYKWA